MNKVLAILAAALLALVVAVLVAPTFFDWNPYRKQIADRISRATGEPVRIDGSVTLKLLPRPLFTASDVTVGDEPGGVSVERVEARLAVWPLFGGDLEARDLTLVRPVFHAALERTSLDDLAALAREGPAARFTERLNVRRGTLHLERNAGKVLSLEDLNLEVSSVGKDRGYQMKGDVHLNGRPVTFGAELGSAESDEAPVSLQLRLPASDASGSFYGRLVTNADHVRLSGDSKIEGPDLDALVSPLFLRDEDRSGKTGERSAQSFTVQAKVEAAPGAVEFNDMSVDAAGVLARASARLAPATDGIRTDLNVRIGRIDLDRILGAEGRIDADRYRRVAERLRLAGVSGSLDLAADAALLRGGVVKDFALLVSLDGGVFSMKRLSAELPGAARAEVTGEVRSLGAAPEFSLALKADAQNLRRTLRWVGYTLPNIPIGRLRSASVSANVASDGAAVSATDVVAEVDGSELQGGLTVSLGERAALALSAVVDRADVDSYFPDLAKGGLLGAIETIAGQDIASQDKADGLPSLLSAFDANVQVRLGQLTVAGTQVHGFVLDALLFKGRLDLRELGYERASGTGFRVSGRVGDLASDPKGTLGFRVAFDDPSGSVRPLSPSLARCLEPWGTVSFEGTVSGSLSDFAVKTSLSGARLDGAVDARIRGAPDDPRYEGQVRLVAGEAGSDQSPPMSLVFRAEGGTSAATIRDIRLEKGGPLVTGRAAIEWTGARPVVQASLTSTRVDLARLGLSDGTARNLPENVLRLILWADTQDGPDLDVLRSFDAELALTAGSVGISPSISIDGVELTAALSDGVLDVRRLEGRYAGGRVEMNGRLAVPGDPVVSATVGIDGAETAALGISSEALSLAGGTFDLALTVGPGGKGGSGGDGEAVRGAGRLEVRNASLHVGSNSEAGFTTGSDTDREVPVVALQAQLALAGDGTVISETTLDSPRGHAQGRFKVDLTDEVIDGGMAFSTGDLAGAVLAVKGPLENPRATLGVPPQQ